MNDQNVKHENTRVEHGPNAFDQAELGFKNHGVKVQVVHGPSAFDQAIISWEAPEYIQHEKGWKWFLAAGIAVLLLAVYSAVTGNWTLVIAILVMSALYVKLHFELPKPIEIIISKAGVKAGRKHIPFQDIKSFWIIYEPPHVKTLNLKMNKTFQQDVTIQLGNQDPGDLREFLCAQVREIEGKKESFADTLIRIFKL